MDFLVKTKQRTEKEELMNKVGEIKNVLTTYEVEVSQLKSKSNLLF